VRFGINDQPWFMIENRFKSQRTLLAIAAEEYHYQGKLDVAFTIIKRNGLLDSIKKEDVKTWFLSPAAQEMTELPNLIDLHDCFGSRCSLRPCIRHRGSSREERHPAQNPQLRRPGHVRAAGGLGDR
jgi:hypothetical protein